MNSDILFYIALSLFFTHQVDAIRCKEWRILPGLSSLKENFAEKLFIAIHIPVFILIFILISIPSPDVKYYFQITIDVMISGHIGKHIILSKNKENLFNDNLSKMIILFSSVFAFIHLCIILSN